MASIEKYDCDQRRRKYSYHVLINVIHIWLKLAASDGCYHRIFPSDQQFTFILAAGKGMGGLNKSMKSWLKR